MKDNVKTVFSVYVCVRSVYEDLPASFVNAHISMDRFISFSRHIFLLF